LVPLYYGRSETPPIQWRAMRETHKSGVHPDASVSARGGGKPPKLLRDARRRPRLRVSLPVHVRPFDARYEDIEDIGQVVDFTRDGLYFKTAMPHYSVGMRLIVTFPYGRKASTRRKFLASIARLEHRENGVHGVAVKFLL